MSNKIAITGASGQLGRLVIDALLAETNASNIIALVRNPDAVADLAAKGIELRKADYDDAPGYVEALKGINKLLLISSSAVGQRVPQHRAVIDAAKANNVSLLAYTSLLNLDTSPIMLGAEHKETETLIRQSGVPFTFLRNGWYNENYTGTLPAVLEHGAVIGHSGEGQVKSAARADFALAAAKVLTSAEDQSGKIYELAGSDGFSKADLAGLVAKASGKEIAYVDMAQEAFAQALIGAGLPEGFAQALADADAGLKAGHLTSDRTDLQDLIGRPTTPIADSIKTALAAL